MNTLIYWSELSPASLDGLIAEHIFGWKWWECSVANKDGIIRKALFPPTGGGWSKTMCNENYRGWCPAKEGTPLFYDWNMLCFRGNGERGHEERGIPKFTTQPGPANEVLERMREDGWSLCVLCSSHDKKLPSPWSVQLDREKTASVIAVAETYEHAVCKAAMKTKGFGIL